MSRCLASAALCVTAAFAGCADGQRGAISAAVFRDPGRFLGQSVRICGYIHDRAEDANIWISRGARREPHGLGLGFYFDDAARRPTKWDDRFTCVIGRIERPGCGKEMMCTQSSFEYGIRLAGDDTAK